MAKATLNELLWNLNPNFMVISRLTHFWQEIPSNL
jgi:hypothetical protein